MKLIQVLFLISKYRPLSLLFAPAINILFICKPYYKPITPVLIVTKLCLHTPELLNSSILTFNANSNTTLSHKCNISIISLPTLHNFQDIYNNPIPPPSQSFHIVSIAPQKATQARIDSILDNPVIFNADTGDVTSTHNDLENFPQDIVSVDIQTLPLWYYYCSV